MRALTALAPAKINLGLFLGPVRAHDGRHELVSVMQSISLADAVTLAPAAGASGDELICPGVAGEPSANLAARALAAFRERTGWQEGPLRVSVEKRIPVAAGLGGGSADAAAVLRLAAAASGLGDRAALLEIAGGLGADVPAQVAPGRWLAGGAGERLRPLRDPRERLGVVVLAPGRELSTPAVYAQADALGPPRPLAELREREAELHAALVWGAAVPAATELLRNDLQRAAVSLCPEIAPALVAMREAGADVVLVSGSGPTVLGLFPRSGELLGDGPEFARRAAEDLKAAGWPRVWAAEPVGADAAEPAPAAGGGGAAAGA